MSKGTGIILAILGVILVFAITIGGSYNSLVTKSENVDTKYANISVMLERRADLIPNLVNTVKGYTSHETEIIDKITKARQNLLAAKDVEDKAKANEELTKSLDALMVVVENYPDLKSSENFIQLSDELAGTENRIAVARKDYNDAVKSYNTTIKKFPMNLISGMFGYSKKEYFEASEESTKVPNVEF